MAAWSRGVICDMVALRLLRQLDALKGKGVDNLFLVAVSRLERVNRALFLSFVSSKSALAAVETNFVCLFRSPVPVVPVCFFGGSRVSGVNIPWTTPCERLLVGTMLTCPRQNCPSHD